MNPYFEQMILGASPVELIRLLYQRAIRGVREARQHLEAGRIAERSSAISHAYAVITELMSALNDEEAPEIAARLRGLYVYVQERLVEANLKQADAPLADALGVLTVLSEAWQGQGAPDAQPATPAGQWMQPPASDGERVAFSA